MTAKDILGLLVRVFALLLMVFGLYDAFYSIIELSGYLPQSQRPPVQHGVFGAFYYVVGYIIIKCAHRITDFAYSAKPRGN